MEPHLFIPFPQPHTPFDQQFCEVDTSCHLVRLHDVWRTAYLDTAGAYSSASILYQTIRCTTFLLGRFCITDTSNAHFIHLTPSSIVSGCKKRYGFTSSCSDCTHHDISKPCRLSKKKLQERRESPFSGSFWCSGWP